MNEVDSKLVDLRIDAIPGQRSEVNVNENVINPKVSIESLVDGFSKEDYKSAFFLLMNQVSPENFLSLTNGDLPHLKTKFIEIYRSFKDETILIELFGTLKMYKKLKLFDTCFHIYESKRNAFNQIEGIWKVLYSLCEELTDEDLRVLKEGVPESSRNSIQSAEDWFCWAFNENIFSRTDLSPLETIFKGFPNCINIIKSLKDYELYPLKVPSSSSHCGIALILNYEKFDENSELKQRQNSDKDVGALKKLWKNFGFETQDHSNLNYSQTFKVIKDCAMKNHSQYDAFVCCILSHGMSDSVYSSDGQLMEISNLIKPITNDCTTLINKPKLFFIQACQGLYIHQGAGKPVHYIPETIHVQKYKLEPPPIMMDTLISQSTIPGYVSFRYDKGSWFIQTLCKVMEQYGDTCSIHEVLTKVSNEISNGFSADFGPVGPKAALQTSVYKSTLRKILILKKCSK